MKLCKGARCVDNRTVIDQLPLVLILPLTDVHNSLVSPHLHTANSPERCINSSQLQKGSSVAPSPVTYMNHALLGCALTSPPLSTLFKTATFPATT